MAAPDASATPPSPSNASGFAATFGIDEDAPRWQQDNLRGLQLASAGAWGEASSAFSSAADALAAIQPGDPAAHDGLALVLANLAQACFFGGQTDDAIAHAQRACAIRAALCGEDAVTTARARSDLAVMLASTGRLAEAPALMSRSIAGVEQSVGDEDASLAALLENAGRMALVAAQPATAEPHLLRLHALLSAHGKSTAPAEALLLRVLDARRAAEVESEAQVIVESQPAVIAARDVDARPPAADVTLEPMPPSPIAEDAEEWEDQPLRDAVFLTDALLRTTPSGVPVIRDEPFDGGGLEFTDDADATIENESGAAAEMQSADARASEQPTGGLGFVVEYGVPLEPEAPPATTSAFPEPTDASMVPELSTRNLIEPEPVEPELEFVPQASLAPDVSTSVTQELLLSQMPSQLPSSAPVALQPVAPRADGIPQNHPPARPTVHTMNAVQADEPRRRVATPRVAGAKTPEKSRAPLIGGGIGAIIVAIAGWWFTRG